MIPAIHLRIKRLPAAGGELPAVCEASEDLASPEKRLSEKDERPCLGAPSDTTARYPDALRLSAVSPAVLSSAEACSYAQPFFSSPPPLCL
jgi:hypothetical protein